MKRISSIALERIGDLAEEWLNSRHHTRKRLAELILLNAELILNHGTSEDIKDLIKYIEDHEENFQKLISGTFKLPQEKSLPQYLH